MAYCIGIFLALAAFLFARFTGLDRDRAFYPTVMIVIALIYGLFAVLGGDMTTLGWESIGIVGFILTAVLGFKFNLWLVVAALAGHGVFDLFHGHVIANAGVPVWWPSFCMTYDVTAAVGLAWLLRKSKVAAKAGAKSPSE